jgi:signal transduction histidine kinase
VERVTARTHALVLVALILATLTSAWSVQRATTTADTAAIEAAADSVAAVTTARLEQLVATTSSAALLFAAAQRQGMSDSFADLVPDATVVGRTPGMRGMLLLLPNGAPVLARPTELAGPLSTTAVREAVAAALPSSSDASITFIPLDAASAAASGADVLAVSPVDLPAGSGWMATVVDVDEMITHDSTTTTGVVVSVVDVDSGVTVVGTADGTTTASSLERVVTISGTSWRLEVVPAAGVTTPSSLPAIVLVVVGALLTLAVHLSLRRAEQARDVALDRVDPTLAELRRANHELRSRNDELDAFTGTVSHDLKGPLTSLLGFIEISLQTGTPEDIRAVVLERAVGVGRRMDALIEGLLGYALSGGGTGAIDDIDLRVPVALAIEALDHDLAVSGGTVDVGPLPRASGDQDRLTQVVQNLVANALRHGVGESGVPHIWISGSSDGSTATLLVEDAGRGIPEHEREAILVPFVRGDSTTTPGTGLGLATTARLLQAMGGHLRIATGEHGGAAFHVELPAATQPDGATTPGTGTDAQPTQPDQQDGTPHHSLVPWR